MANPWARLEIGYLNHPKFIALNANAICLWHEGKAYCDRHHTDGLIPRDALKTFRFRGVKAMGLLTAPCPMLKPDGTPYAPLWEAHAIGFIMHDYLDHNDCREEILDRISNADLKRDRDRRRMQLWRDKELIAQIRARDGDCCRYCHRAVDWADRRGAYGATYDHINPEGENTLENIVVACRGCNSVKGNKSLAVAGMTLLQPKQVSTARSKSVVEMSQATSRESRAETETETETETLSLRRETDVTDQFGDLPECDGPDGQVLFQQLAATYPVERLTDDAPTVDAFLAALGPDMLEWDERYALMRRTLEAHKASEQWQNTRYAPNLITWLKRGDWRGGRQLAPVGATPIQNNNCAPVRSTLSPAMQARIKARQTA